MRDRKGRRGAHSDLHNPAPGKAGSSSGGQDIRLSEAEAEKALPVKGPEPEGAIGAGLIGRTSGMAFTLSGEGFRNSRQPQLRCMVSLILQLLQAVQTLLNTQEYCLDMMFPSFIHKHIADRNVLLAAQRVNYIDNN